MPPISPRSPSPDPWAPFHAARAEERLNRLLAWLPLAPRLCGCPVVPLTCRHLIELELAGNPCVVNGAPARAAVFDFLWRLNPDFRRPDGSLPNVPRGRPRPSRLRCWLAQRRVRRQVGRRDFGLRSAVAAIKGRIAVSYQDQAADVTDGRGLRSPLAPDRHWIESFLEFFGNRFGWSHDHVLDAPIALLFQLYRSHCLAHGMVALFVPPSDALVPPANP